MTAKEKQKRRHERVYGRGHRGVVRSLNRIFGMVCIFLMLGGCSSGPRFDPTIKTESHWTRRV